MEKGVNKHFSEKVTIAIASGKGGVGKSTLTTCLAHLLTELGYKVGVLDADLYGPSMPLMLPPDRPTGSFENKIAPASSQGIKVISMGHFKQGEKASIVRAPIANATINQFLHGVEWGEIEVLLVDLPPGTGDIPLTLMQSISLSGAIIVTTPQNISVSDVRKSIEMFLKMKVPIYGIIENMSYYLDSLTQEKHFIFGEGGGELLSNEFSIPLLGKVPLDPEMSRAMDEGRSLFSQGGPSVCKEVILQIGVEISQKVCHDGGVKKSFIEIKESDTYHFLADFGDGPREYRYSNLQRCCPCARCFDRVYERNVVDIESIDEYVSVEKIEKVGQYGIRFHFTSGCKQGIYTWRQLEASLSQ